MFAQVIRSSRILTAKTSVRAFSVAPVRYNLISDLYVRELKSFKPAPLSEAEAASSTKPWAVPAAAKVPEVEGSAEELAAYDSAEVTTESVKEGEVSSAAEEDWFVFPEEEEHHH
ncbi:hypothetical protein PACTADRAFT_3505 [Pachysolen tannophilus NRRL Y-2460]|uniref:ATP synthase subunit H, mitochondrial n=1 Tax=Pachysolen tannophilus NRRL Y-2460 TaxID=669874 RepID=A0A1E4TSA4_PACTA|nr:hypothetical protein PACTADRAFT_3505 [Pachysolen tannophilus NRRL Y-2460]